MKMPNFPDKFFFVIVLGLLIFLFFYKYFALFKAPASQYKEDADITKASTNSFWGTNKKDEVIEENWIPTNSSNKNWWLNSGAYLYIKDGKASTIQGKLAENNEWRIKYSKNSPDETEDGYYPQNIFRLVSNSKFKDTQQELHFIIHDYHLSESENRSESNGVLLFSDYEDSDNLYYAGLRVDGTAVIKRKCDTKYETLLQQKILLGEYDRNSNPNLLNLNHEYAIKTTTTHKKDNTTDTTNLQLYVKLASDLEWDLIGEISDVHECKPSTESSVGIRTDFMDVEFTNYSVKTLKTQAE